jgi:hypothetical protein
MTSKKHRGDASVSIPLDAWSLIANYGANDIHTLLLLSRDIQSHIIKSLSRKENFDCFVAELKAMATNFQLKHSEYLTKRYVNLAAVFKFVTKQLRKKGYSMPFDAVHIVNLMAPRLEHSDACTSIVKTILRMKDVMLSDDQAKSLFAQAKHFHNITILDRLLPKYKCISNAPEKNELLKYAATRNDMKLIRYLVEHQNVLPQANGSSALREAAKRNLRDVVLYFLKDGRSKPPSGSVNGMLLYCAKSNDIELLKLVLQNEHYSPDKDQSFIEAVSEMVFQKHINLLKILIKDNRSNNAWILNEVASGGTKRMMKMVLKYVDPSADDRALFYAVTGNKDTALVLLKDKETKPTGVLKLLCSKTGPKQIIQFDFLKPEMKQMLLNDDRIDANLRKLLAAKQYDKVIELLGE